MIAEIADRGTMLTLGSSFNVKPIATPVENVADVERVLASLAAGANGGLIVNSDIFTVRNRVAIITAAARRTRNLSVRLLHRRRRIGRLWHRHTRFVATRCVVP